MSTVYRVSSSTDTPSRLLEEVGDSARASDQLHASCTVLPHGSSRRVGALYERVDRSNGLTGQHLPRR